LDLWPYINGKALVSGLDLKEMELSDMLDVIHFFFEDDHRYTTAEEAKAVESIRSSLYETIYKIKYKYKSSGVNGNTNSNVTYDPNQIKPYIPPTEFDADKGLQFGNIVEAPLR
jgi:hypothetical protein